MRETLQDCVNQYVPVGCLFMQVSSLKITSRKQICLFKRAVKEREHLGYTGPFVMQGLEMSETGEVSEPAVKQLTPKAQWLTGCWQIEVKAISTKFMSAAWPQVHDSMCLVTMTQLPHRSIPGKTLPDLG